MPASHMNIDRHNYEEFFILYLDNELTAEERRRVEDFAAANPDLKEELDLLLQSKLVPDTAIVFNSKEELLKQESPIGSHNYTEWLLLYADNELDPAHKATLEQWIAQNPAAGQELALLQKARLQPDETIVFTDKYLLYRKEEGRVAPIRWWRMAAAAALLLAVSTATFMFNRKHSDSIASNGDRETRPVAQTNVQTGKDTHSVAPSITEKSIESSTTAINLQKDAVVAKKNNDEQAATTTTTIITQTAAVPDNTQQPEESTPAVMVKRTSINELLADQSVTGTDLAADPSLTIRKEINALPDVTQEEVQPFDIMNQSEKKNRLRGFFRKITRTFEKTTNIKATDGEDRLLVGGLAIKF
ncbi:MAG: hypothetical protein J0I32_03545 [Sphingobacteriales bacterium]|nr:hypothetical protein [Sphingobacteriales bacterium]